MAGALGVRIDRFVPFPQSISEEARDALALNVGEDGQPIRLGGFPFVDDAAAWGRAKEMSAQFMNELAERMTANATASVETGEIAGVVVHVATPAGGHDGNRVYLDVHGGALVFGDGAYCRAAAVVAAQLHGVKAVSVDYRMPPAHPYPAGLDDCLAVYRALLKSHAPDHIVIGGASAGGNLAAATVLRARDEGLPLPGAVVLMTPEIDLTESGDSFETNQMLDVVLPSRLMNANLLYANGHDLAHPYLSPLFGDFTKGFPPTLIQAGTRDLFLSNAARMQQNLRRAGVPVELLLCEGMPHGGFKGAPEDRELAGDVADFVARHWGRRP